LDGVIIKWIGLRKVITLSGPALVAEWSEHSAEVRASARARPPTKSIISNNSYMHMTNRDLISGR